MPDSGCVPAPEPDRCWISVLPENHSGTVPKRFPAPCGFSPDTGARRCRPTAAARLQIRRCEPRPRQKDRADTAGHTPAAAAAVVPTVGRRGPPSPEPGPAAAAEWRRAFSAVAVPPGTGAVPRLPGPLPDSGPRWSVPSPPKAAASGAVFPPSAVGAGWSVIRRCGPLPGAFSAAG